jgi:PTS system nitrogen regulatory IIA component
MKINELIAPERVCANSQATSKKRVLEELSGLMADTESELTPEQVFESLIGRERLGSTGMGHGVAIPHGRVPGCDHAVGAFLKLEHGIDYDAIDGEPVDLLFALMVPDHFTDEHLDLLAQVAQLLGNPELCEQLRGTQDAQQIFQLITHWQPSPSSTSA